jgi:hypothetical protein
VEDVVLQLELSDFSIYSVLETVWSNQHALLNDGDLQNNYYVKPATTNSICEKVYWELVRFAPERFQPGVGGSLPLPFIDGDSLCYIIKVKLATGSLTTTTGSKLVEYTYLVKLIATSDPDVWLNNNVLSVTVTAGQVQPGIDMNHTILASAASPMQMRTQLVSMASEYYPVSEQMTTTQLQQTQQLIYWLARPRGTYVPRTKSSDGTYVPRSTRSGGGGSRSTGGTWPGAPPVPGSSSRNVPVDPRFDMTIKTISTRLMPAADEANILSFLDIDITDSTYNDDLKKTAADAIDTVSKYFFDHMPFTSFDDLKTQVEEKIERMTERVKKFTWSDLNRFFERSLEILFAEDPDIPPGLDMFVESRDTVYGFLQDAGDKYVPVWLSSLLKNIKWSNAVDTFTMLADLISDPDYRDIIFDKDFIMEKKDEFITTTLTELMTTVYDLAKDVLEDLTGFMTEITEKVLQMDPTFAKETDEGTIECNDEVTIDDFIPIVNETPEILRSPWVPDEEYTSRFEEMQTLQYSLTEEQSEYEDLVYRYKDTNVNIVEKYIESNVTDTDYNTEKSSEETIKQAKEAEVTSVSNELILAEIASANAETEYERLLSEYEELTGSELRDAYEQAKLEREQARNAYDTGLEELSRINAELTRHEEEAWGTGTEDDEEEQNCLDLQAQLRNDLDAQQLIVDELFREFNAKDQAEIAAETAYRNGVSESDRSSLDTKLAEVNAAKALMDTANAAVQQLTQTKSSAENIVSQKAASLILIKNEYDTDKAQIARELKTYDDLKGVLKPQMDQSKGAIDQLIDRIGTAVEYLKSFTRVKIVF